MALIEVEGVHVRFGERVVLESIDLAVPEGEFHGLMGPNGAGKTTFFNVLTGRVKPSCSQVRNMVADMPNMRETSLMRRYPAPSPPGPTLGVAALRPFRLDKPACLSLTLRDYSKVAGARNHVIGTKSQTSR